MYPTISLGSLSISTYNLMRAMAALVMLVGGIYRMRRAKWRFPVYDIVNATAYALLGVIGGAWLASVLPDAVMYLRGTSLPPMWWLQGRHWMGAIGGASLMGYIYCRRHNLSAGRAFDILVPLAPLVQAIGRIGCLLAGCCYGRETTAWPSLVLPDSNGVWASRYPTRIASIVANMLIFALLLALERYAVKRQGESAGWPFDGFLYFLYIELYCAQRFFFEFWRADMPQLIGPFTWTHLYCVIGIGLATWGIVRGLRRAREVPVTD